MTHPDRTDGAGADAAPGFDYDAIDVGYYDRVYRRASGVRSKWHHLKFAHVRRALPPSSKHLDIGSGPGTFIGRLPDSIESVGVDIAGPQIRHARAHYGAPRRRFELIRAEDPPPFADGSFNTVTCIELIKHLPVDSVCSLLTEVRRVLRPGGAFLVTTPDYGGLWPLLERVVNRVGEVSYADQNITRLDRPRLLSLLRDAGFVGARATRFQFAAPFAAALGWGLADRVARWEPGWLVARAGFLLLGEGRAPA